MKAVVQEIYGPPEVLAVGEVDTPEPKAGEVLVRVAAAGLGADVWHSTTGLPYPVRLVAGLRRPRQNVAGLDVAGEVVKLGPDVTDLRVGDTVFGTGFGTFAELARARADRLARVPHGADVTLAAAVPISGVTALQAVRDKARVGEGARVAVLGAGGAVGSFAVQIAKILGAEVTGVCGPTKTDLVAELGADRVVDYTEGDFGSGERYDAIIDTAGNRSLRALRSALAPRGALVIVGAETGGRWLGGVDRLLRAGMIAPFTRQRLGSLLAVEDRAELEVLAGHLESGRLRPVVSATCGLDGVPRAMRRWSEGHARGRTVVTVA